MTARLKSTRLRASPVVVSDGFVLLVRLRDPVSGEEAFYPPGGMIEADEEPAATAERETLEETGVRIVVDQELTLVAHYPFCWAGVTRAITTHFFAATLAEGQDRTLSPVIDADYNLGAEWRPTAEALRLLAVHPPIADAAREILTRAASRQRR